MKSYQHFIRGSIMLGISAGTVSLLARWITGNSILSSPESLVKYGLLGGIGYSLSGALAIFLFGLLAPRIKRNSPQFSTLGDMLNYRLQKDGYWLMACIILFLGLDSLFMQAIGAAVLFDLLFNIPLSITLFFFLLYCFIISMIGGMKWIHRFEGFAISLIFAAVIFIPLYFFIQEGSVKVYEGIRLYHPYLLFTKNKEAFYFIFTFIIVAFGQVLTDRVTWQRLYMMNPSKIRITFSSTAIIWSSIPVALSAMLMIVLFEGPFKNSNALLFELFNKIDLPFLTILFFLFCFATLSTTMKAELHATSIHFVKHILLPMSGELSYVEMKKQSNYFAIFLLSGIFIAIHFVQFNLIHFLFFFGNLYSAAVPVMLIIIYTKKTLPRALPYSTIAGFTISLVLTQSLSSFETIWYSFLLSTTFAILFLVKAKYTSTKF
ncbi:sodium:solute symporter family transporter [Viridibacillus arvi]|uniref:sodium:solute symporter family transporter n=1 Tax=Viridibacillus arvi TaxID=263475 RepID=UPI003CFC4924